MTELPIYGPNELAPGETREPENVNGRFRIKCPDGKQRLYTRTTTFIDSLEDKTTLEKWKQRVILIGLDADPSLILEVAKTSPEDKDAMNKIAERAFEAGDGYLKARKGTDLHHLTYLWDTGGLVPRSLNESDAADVAAYAGLCVRHNLVPLHRERRIVLDDIKVTGTPDAVYRYKCLDGVTRNVIGDVKTGRVDYGQGKMAQQLALYAAGEWYTDDGSETGLREPMDVDRTIGLILEVPQGGAIQGVKPQLYEVELDTGWYGVHLSKRVRNWRNWSKRCFTPVP